MLLLFLTGAIRGGRSFPARRPRRVGRPPDELIAGDLSRQPKSDAEIALALTLAARDYGEPRIVTTQRIPATD